MPVHLDADGKMSLFLPDGYQRVFFFLAETFPGEICPAHRCPRPRKRRQSVPSPDNGRAGHGPGGTGA